MWIPKTRWAGAVIIVVFICFTFADCSSETKSEDADAAIAVETEAESLEEDIFEEDESHPEAIDNRAEEAEAVIDGNTANEQAVNQQEVVSQSAQPSSAQVAASPPVQTAAAQTKYSVVDPDGVTYTGYEPMYIVCGCGEQFSSGTLWQAHRDYFSAFRCSCGASFSGTGEWESHAGVYDPATFLYTGKTRAEATAEGHTLVNEAAHSAEYSAHNSWKTTGFPG